MGIIPNKDIMDITFQDILREARCSGEMRSGFTIYQLRQSMEHVMLSTIAWSGHTTTTTPTMRATEMDVEHNEA